MACFRKRKFDDHGHIIDLEPGQLCISEDDLRKLCHASISANDIHRGIVKLKLCGFLNQKVNHRKSVITITYPGFYNIDENESEPKSEPNLNQTRTTKEECKEGKEDIFRSTNVLPSHSLASLRSGADNTSSLQCNITSKLRHHDFPQEVKDLTDLFLKKILLFKPDLKPPNIQSWQKEFDKMLRLDKRSPEKVKEILEWLPTNPFWRKNILSAAKFREQFDRLQLAEEDKTIPINRYKIDRTEGAYGSITPKNSKVEW